jgi:hypothetical protein
LSALEPAGAVEIMAEAAYAAFLAGGHLSLDFVPGWDDQAEDVREHWREKTKASFGDALLRLYDHWDGRLEAAMHDRSDQLKGCWRNTLAQRIKAELHSEDVASDVSLAGPLGEAIANSSGSYSLEFTTPEQLAEGIVAWLGLHPERRVGT